MGKANFYCDTLWNVFSIWICFSQHSLNCSLWQGRQKHFTTYIAITIIILFNSYSFLLGPWSHGGTARVLRAWGIRQFVMCLLLAVLDREMPPVLTRYTTYCGCVLLLIAWLPHEMKHYINYLSFVFLQATILVVLTIKVCVLFRKHLPYL